MKKYVFLILIIALCTLLFACNEEGTHVHTYAEWTVDVEATCETDGTKSSVCTVCGETDSETIAKTGHALATVARIVYPTCTEDGLDGQICVNNGCIYVKETIVPAKGHEYGSWTYDIEGETRSEICTSCGYVDTETLDHVFNLWNTITPATCISEGLRRRECRYCDFFEEDVLAINENAHTYGSWNTVTESGCFHDEGERTRTCTDCEHVDEGIIDAGHDFDSNGECGKGCGFVLCSESDFTYDPLATAISNSYVIQNYIGTNEKIVIPSAIRGRYIVSSIESNAFKDSDVTHVVIPVTVIEIGDNAFDTADPVVLIFNSPSPQLLSFDIEKANVSVIYVPDDAVSDYEDAYGDFVTVLGISEFAG